MFICDSETLLVSLNVVTSRCIVVLMTSISRNYSRIAVNDSDAELCLRIHDVRICTASAQIS